MVSEQLERVSMGYHLIIPTESGAIRYYLEDMRELAYIDDLTEQTIFYEAPESQIPRRLTKDKKYGKYIELQFRLGLKAEDLFKDQARANKFILIEIDQSQEGFAQYKDCIDAKIKRGDFLVRNANLEVDVKCKTIYYPKGEGFFCLNVSDVERHINMMKNTRTPVIIAVYERDNDEPDPDSLYMIELEKIKTCITENLITLANNSCYKIPLDLTEKGFELLERFRIK